MLYLGTVLFIHWLIVLVLWVRVMVRRPPVGVAVAWLAVISTAPFLGAVIYLLFGERRLGRKRTARIASYWPTLQRWQASLRPPAAENVPEVPIQRQAEQVLGFPAQGGNRLELFSDFQSVFDQLVADIDSATRSCHLCFYIWHEGGRTEDVVEALIRAARRGVDCQVLADAIGSRAFLHSDSAGRMRAAGVVVAAALPTGGLRTFLVRRDLRNHRKIVVIDQTIAYSGSQNLVDPRFFKQDAGVGEWVDAMARITGPTAGVLDGVFALDWSVEANARLELPAPVAPAYPTDRPASIQVVPSGPDLRPEAIHQLLLTAIYSAKQEIVMTTPYFVPDEAIITALLSAALRGVIVTLIVPSRNDSIMVRFASEANFEGLLAAGARIALFDGGLLHTKSLTVDHSLCIFGSVNLDMRSLWLNFEISLFVYDPEFTQSIRELQASYLAASHRLDGEVWSQRSNLQKAAEYAFRLLGPLL
ncbi:MAG TPA: cardiolipin synthase [Planctomycetota bacterium]|nr:cardiolipin synthase [Planctomycetota bacterium]